MATEKNDIRRMSKKDLLEILLLQSKKIDELQNELERVTKLLDSKDILISEYGSIAEASLGLNKVFEVAQKAADQYLQNIKRLEKKQERLCLRLEKEYNNKKSIKVKKTIKGSKDIKKEVAK